MLSSGSSHIQLNTFEGIKSKTWYS